MRKLVGLSIAVLAMLAAVLTAVPADASGGGGHGLPSEIELPEGFFPEGIASGRGPKFYVGSLADGTIYRGDFRTGQGEVLTEPIGNFATIGLAVDRLGRVWAAGGVTGTGRVYDGRSGELLASYEFTGPFESFINDVIVTRQGAWFTDSGTQNDPDPAALQFAGSPRLFHVPLTPTGQLPDSGAVEEMPLPDVPDVAFPNLNGIETTPNGRSLIVAHNVLGELWVIDPATGAGSRIVIDQPLDGPDGLLRKGRTLYVVEPGVRGVTTVRLDQRGTSGEVRRVVTIPGSETPTTAAFYRQGLYVVDARFLSNTGPYRVVRVPLTCNNIKAKGSGQGAPPLPGDPPNLVRTMADIRSGLLKGTTEAAFTITDPTPPVFSFAGQLTFTTKRGTLTVDLTGTLDVTSGAFTSSGAVSAGTGRFHGAVGNLTLDGTQDLADPAGAFTETVLGEVCADPGRR